MTDLSLLGETKTITLQLLRGEARTASGIASNLHIQVSAARKHLEQLRSLGLVSDSFQREGVGRPRKFYALTEKGRELFPRHYETLLNLLLEKLVGREGTSQAESIMKSIAADVAKNVNGQDPHDGKKMDKISAGINKLGFEATLTRHDGQITVISRNCPVWKIALKHREIVCRGFHAQILQDALKGKHVERQEWMPDGDSYCKHSVEVHTSNGNRTP